MSNCQELTKQFMNLCEVAAAEKEFNSRLPMEEKLNYLWPRK